MPAMTDLKREYSILKRKFAILEEDYLVAKRVRESLEARLKLAEHALAAPRKLTREQVHEAVFIGVTNGEGLPNKTVSAVTDNIMRLLEALHAPPSEVAQTEGSK